MINCLEKRIGYKFKNINLLKKALYHSSYVNEQSSKIANNEVFEFLGDAVLNLIISSFLIKYYPKLKEGDLSKIRAKVINEVQLYNVAKSIELGYYIFLGKGEVKTGGREKPSILANTLEAIIASIYIDSDIINTSIVIKNLFLKIIKSFKFKKEIFLDNKSKLQEKIQLTYHEIPNYYLVNEYGPDLNKFFKVKMAIGDLESFGKGSSKKLAEQAAAKKGLTKLLKKITNRD